MMISGREDLKKNHYNRVRASSSGLYELLLKEKKVSRTKRFYNWVDAFYWLESVLLVKK